MFNTEKHLHLISKHFKILISFYFSFSFCEVDHMLFFSNCTNTFTLCISLSLNIAMLTIYTKKVFCKEKKPYFEIHRMQTGCTLECIEIIRKQAVRNTDGMPLSDRFVYCIGHNLVIRTDVPIVHNISLISPLPLILSSGHMNNR